MTVKLPTKYLERMEHMLKDEYDDFLDSYKQKRYFALRVNTLKVSVDIFKEIFPYDLSPVPWCDTGFYYDGKNKPGKHPYHAAGLYYIQEPSAMAVAEAVGIRPGDKVLDLSAAPGGKSTQAAAELNGGGLLVANEISPQRVVSLTENIERMGIKNAVVLNEDPANLCKVFRGYFDKIIVDAPCSGEGMFRKDPEVCYTWSEGTVKSMSRIQLGILNTASQMLKVGGCMSYSTCTFSPEEDEMVVEQFLKENKDFELIDMPVKKYFDSGRPEWAGGSIDISKTARLWPHKIMGEGHFIAVFRRKDGDALKTREKRYSAKINKITDYINFEKEYLNIGLDKDKIYVSENKVYYTSGAFPDITGLRTVRYGWYLGDMKKSRFEPSHALAMGLTQGDVRLNINLDYKNQNGDVYAYLRGQELNSDMKGYKGWALVDVDGYGLGWAKVSEGRVKNHYPKQLRIDW